MLPGEREHTKEPAYDKDFKDFYWPPVFSDPTSKAETSGRGEASSSQDGSNMAASVSSKSTTPPSEVEIPVEHCDIKSDADTRLDFLADRPVSEEEMVDGAQTRLKNEPPIDSRKPDIAVNAGEPLSSGDVMAENESLFSEKESLPAESTNSSETVMKLDDSDTIVDSSVNHLLGPEKTTTQADLKLLAESHSADVVSVSDTNDIDDQKHIGVKALIEKSSVAIACPKTVSATDPPSSRLRHMVANSPSIITCPGVYDGLSARIALQVGFKGMYMTGAGTTASCLGASDLGIAHLHDMRTNAEMIANLQPDGPPLIADMDTGYGGPLIISRAVKQYARAGVAAFHIEDQVPEKRCGHLSGKEVVDVDTYLGRIKACLVARSQIRSDIIIIARTDALQSRGYDDCVERLRQARDLGADMGILEGLPSKEAAAQAVIDLAPWPLCYNSVENGHSPLITADEAQAMGYRLMIFSFAGIAPAYMAILETFTKLKARGVTDCGVGPKKIFEVCGLAEEMRIDEAAGGSAFAKGV